MLKETGLDRDTLVFFASDNGAGFKRGREFFRSTLDFREAKGSVYEGGIRTPMIARWPGNIRPGLGERVALGLLGFPAHRGRTGRRAKRPPNIDGISVLPTLLGKPQKPHDYLYWESNGGKGGFRQAIRMGNWKGVRKGLEGPLELYDLARDRAEKNDVAAQHPEVVARMQAALKTARTDTDEYPVKRPKKKQKSA